MHPTKQEIKDIHRLYKKTFAFDDGGTIDPYFQYQFHPENCWIIRDDNQIVSLLCAHPHRMYFHNGYLPVRFISGVITVEKKRHQGYMRRCFEELLKETQDTCGLYVLQAYHPEIYTSLGFEQRYFIRYVPYLGAALPNHCIPITSAVDCADCAQAALREWEGWMDHDEDFYQAQLREAAALHQTILGFYENGQLAAFARWSQSETVMAIEEILARSNHAKQRLLAQLASCPKRLLYAVPALAKEHGAQGNLMVKMGNQALCQKNLGHMITTCDDLYESDQRYYHYGWW